MDELSLGLILFIDIVKYVLIFGTYILTFFIGRWSLYNFKVSWRNKGEDVKSIPIIKSDGK